MKNKANFLLTLCLCLQTNLFATDEKKLSDFYEIAKEKCQDIPSIRKEMDRINEEIILLLTERTAFVKRAGDLKSKTTKVADDRVRVQEQEEKIILQSILHDLPIEISVPVFREIMEHSIRFQQDYIDRNYKQY
ncbi:MAG: hypothetical protein BGO10_00545 [Chlamydia sp. 32-24]|nr:MAG: hypothetical protein BGO10_00545 [Chlamydia sp. 32-24]